MPDSIHDLSRALGQVEGTVRGLVGTVEGLRAQFASQEQNASDGRRAIHTKVDAVSSQVNGLKLQVEGLSRDLNGAKPIIENYRNQHQRRLGRRELAGWVLAALGAIGTAVAVLDKLH